MQETISDSCPAFSSLELHSRKPRVQEESLGVPLEQTAEEGVFQMWDPVQGGWRRFFHNPWEKWAGYWAAEPHHRKTSSFQATCLPHTQPIRAFLGIKTGARLHNNDPRSQTNEHWLFDNTSAILLGDPALWYNSRGSNLEPSVCVWINTAPLFPYARDRPLQLGLARLTRKWLGNNLHDPEVDAGACIDLLEAKSEHGLFFRDSYSSAATYHLTTSLAQGLDAVSSGQIMHRFTRASRSHTCRLQAQRRTLCLHGATSAPKSVDRQLCLPRPSRVGTMRSLVGFSVC